MVFDVLRFGEGAAESYETGRIAPLVQDVFRGMSIAGGVGKLGQIGRLKAGKVLNLYANAGGQTCAPIAMGNALRRTGKYLFLSLEEIAAAHGVSLAEIAKSGVNMASSISALRKLGVTFQVLKALSFENLCARMIGKEGVMMIRLVGSNGGAAHRVILERVGGVVKILDRCGEFASLELLSARYASVLKGGKFIVDAAADAVHIPQVTALFVNGVPTLMVAANAIVRLADDTSVAALDDKFERFKKERGGSNVIHLSPPPKVTVAHGDTLSGLSRKHYGSIEYWPLIWDVNKETIGANPNRIAPGMTLTIPALSAFGEKEKADARRRTPAWRNY
jgi:hypothetical protein